MEPEETKELAGAEEGYRLLFGMEDFVDGLKEALDEHFEKVDKAQAQGERMEPLVIGVMGQWGSGKSSVLHCVKDLIEADLRERRGLLGDTDVSRLRTAVTSTLTWLEAHLPGFPEPPEPQQDVTIPVFFNPWRYEQEAHLIVPLLKTTELTLGRWAASGTDPQGLTPALRRAAREVWGAALAVASGLKFKVSLLGLKSEVDVGKILKEDRERHAYLKGSSAASPASRLESVYYEILQHLEDITRPKSGARLNLVFVIDDLDRCLPEKAVQMLEAIKLFLDVPGCAFVLGVDEEVIERGIAHRYRDYNRQADTTNDAVAYVQDPDKYAQYQALRGAPLAAPITGHEYLEKIVHLAFRLPVNTGTQVEEFLRVRYPELFAPEPVEGADQLVDADTASKLLSIFKHAVPAVPRKLIRAAESLKLWLRVARRRGLEEADPLLGARFVFMQQFAPELYRFGREYGRLLITVREWWDEGWRTNVRLDEKMLKASGVDKEEDRYTWHNVYRPLARHLRALGRSRSGFQPSRLVTDQYFEADGANLRPYYELVAQAGEVAVDRVSPKAKAAPAPAEVEEPEAPEEVKPPLQAGRPGEPERRPKPARSARPEPTAAFVPTDPEAFFGQLFSSDPNVRSNAIEQEGEAIEGRVLEQKVFDQLLKAAMEQDETRCLDWVPTIYPFLAPAEQAATLAERRFSREKLIPLMQSRELSNHQRRAAGLLLGATGWLPEDLDVFIPVADEPFVYGEAKAQEKGKTLGYDFRIGKYPVTNAQYRRFMEEGGYDREKGADFWDEEGRAWLQEGAASAPRLWDDGRWNNPVFPVVGVSWHEARAYGRWLALRVAADPKRHGVELSPPRERLEVRLPSEEEWERAARGTDGRAYPWGDEFETWRANTREGAAGATTAAATFPDGVSPVGAWDMSGNVWEWTGSRYSEGEPNRVVRGGSWGGFQVIARPADRSWVLPEVRYDLPGFSVGCLHSSIRAGRKFACSTDVRRCRHG